jgi:general stress protein 26
VWFFTSKDNSIVKNLKRTDRGVATFVSKKHDIFATVHGKVRLDKSKENIDALWNPYVAAWFEKGKDDPQLALLRFDLEKAEIWLDDSSVFAGIKLLWGMDPKKEYKTNVAKVLFR